MSNINVLPSEIFFTSDNHYGHELIRTACKRPFASVAEMNEAMIENHNKVVPRGGRVYNLGDMFLKISKAEALAIRKRLNGQMFFIRGNHDSIAEEIAKEAFVWMRSLDRIHFHSPIDKHIVLCHYAMRVWHGSHKGTWQLYGHSHGQLPEIQETLAFDVGVDCWNFTPVSIDQVIEKMQTKLPAWEAYRASLPSGRME